MSEVAAAAPAAPAAPQENSQTPAAPVDPLAEHLAAIEKHGGIDVKVNGKVQKMSLEQLRRYAQKTAPVESALAEIQKQRSEIEPKAALLARLENGSDDERQEALEKLLGPKFTALAEKRLLQEIRNSQKYDGMTERERAMAQQLEAMAEQTKAYEAQRKAEEAKRQESELQAEVSHWRNVLSTVAVDALKSLELPQKLEPMAVELVQPIMRELMRAGRTPSSEELAAHIGDKLAALMEWGFSGNRSAENLKRYAPAVRAYTEAQLAALNAPQQPISSAPAAPKQEQNGTKVVPISGAKWDPRKPFR